MPRLAIDRLVPLLLRPVDDSGVIAAFGQDRLAAMTREEHYGLLEFKPDGFGLVFEAAAFLLKHPLGDDMRLLLSAVHLYREGYADYAGYVGPLPAGLTLGDREEQVRTRLGAPVRAGGGGMSKVLKRPIPRWLRYAPHPLWGRADLHCQFDASDTLELLTLMAPEATARIDGIDRAISAKTESGENSKA